MILHSIQNVDSGLMISKQNEPKCTSIDIAPFHRCCI